MTKQKISVPDVGSSNPVDVIELFVKVGDHINVDAPLLTLESDKASMEVPSSMAGVVTAVFVKLGDKVKSGDAILEVDAPDTKASAVKTEVAKEPEKPAIIQPVAVPEVVEAATPPENRNTPSPVAAVATSSSDADVVHAGPAVRRLAREFGVELSQVTGMGPKNRILKEDIQAYVKQRLAGGGHSVGTVSPMPAIDFSQFGAVESMPLSKIKRVTAQTMHRNWVSIPHVTQFDEADITELEAFRLASKEEFKAQGIHLTMLVFVMKAVVAALKMFPQFNASLDPGGEKLILKKYYNLGIAVDTPNGLVVPVIRQVDMKGMAEIAGELAAISKKAREKGLMPTEMQGSCFTISSLGGIGGTAFTPIINAPDVAILGISKAKQQPVFNQGAFVPRLILPLSLSYDHRVIDGAEAARFSQFIAKSLSDIRRLLL